MSAWPFSQWGIDIVGSLPTAPGGARFLVVAIDYFTKWVEAKPLISTTGKHMEKFVWEHIVCRNAPSIYARLSPPSKRTGRSNKQRNYQRNGAKIGKSTPRIDR
ncbi:reverse transcriptase domain-containing protein [Tanacetum coccineum]